MTALTVAVTGATGFLGSHVCDALLASGHRVRAAHRRSSDLRWLQGKPIELVCTDLADPVALDALLRGCDGLIHGAGVVMADADTYARVNVEGTRLVLEAAARADALRSFVFISSLAAGGSGTLRQPRDETMPDAPISDYGRSKCAAEAEISGRSWPFRTVSLRPPALYGPRDRSFRPLFQAAARGWTVRFGGRLKGLSLVHADDAATAAVRLLIASQAEGVYYLDDGGGLAGPADPGRRWPWGYHLDEMHKVLNGLFNRPLRAVTIPAGLLRLAAGLASPALRRTSPILHPDRRGDWTVDGWVCAAERLQQETGWRARWSLAAGLRDTLFFYRRQGWL